MPAMRNDIGMASGFVAEIGIGQRQGEQPGEQPEPEEIGHG